MEDEYLLDTVAVIEILTGQEKMKRWLENNKSAILNISGWVILELLQYRAKSKTEMDMTLKKLSQYKTLWTEPKFADEVPTLLINHFHSQRRSNGTLSGNAIFDALIYSSAKSYNQKLLTRDKHFEGLKDVEVVNLDIIDNGAYK